MDSLVPHTGFEPVISALRGRCPGPLDECGEVEPTASAEPAGMVASAPAGWQPTGLARRRLEADHVHASAVFALGPPEALHFPGRAAHSHTPHRRDIRDHYIPQP